MSRFAIAMRLTVADSARTTTTSTTSSRVRARELLDEPRRPPSSWRVPELLDEQRPWKMIDNMALLIIDQTYSALLEMLGPDQAPPPPSGDGHVQISGPVDPADPASPLLTVHASATHCCINVYAGGGGDQDYTKATSPEQSWSQYRLAHATITTSPGTLHLARVDGGVGRGKYWACADARPDVAGKGLVAVVETIKARLDAAIRLEDTLLVMPTNSGARGGRSPRMREVVEAREALEKMRPAVDLDAIMRRHRCRRRRELIQEEIACRPDVGHQACDEDVLARRLGTLHVGRKRGCPVQEVSCRLPEQDDAEVLTKKLKALHV